MNILKSLAFRVKTLQLSLSMKSQLNVNTVKSLYSGHHRDPESVCYEEVSAIYRVSHKKGIDKNFHSELPKASIDSF